MIIPAIIAKNQKELELRVSKVKEYVDIMQLDVMDGEFVPNESLNFDFDLPKGIYEAHLMINDPDTWAKQNWSKVDTIILPIETLKDPKGTLDFVKKKGKKVGLVINPESPLDEIIPYLDGIDQVLIMTVHPGFYGSKFIPDALDKVLKLRKLKPKLPIEVDGGITPDTIDQAKKAGATMFVSGSYIQNFDTSKQAIINLKNKEND